VAFPAGAAAPPVVAAGAAGAAGDAADPPDGVVSVALSVAFESAVSLSSSTSVSLWSD
jgi:hypothetical protein